MVSSDDLTLGRDRVDEVLDEKKLALRSREQGLHIKLSSSLKNGQNVGPPLTTATATAFPEPSRHLELIINNNINTYRTVLFCNPYRCLTVY